MAIDATTDARLSRLHAALMTPCDADENIAHGCLKKLVAHVKGLGIDGLYVGGSTGEGLLHSVDERIAVFNTVAEAAGDSARIAHVGAISTRDAVTLAKGAAAAGYDAVSAIPPIYFPHRKEAIFAYYQDILAATDLPLIIYNIPAMSGVSFSLDDLGRLLNLPGVAGIKHHFDHIGICKVLHRVNRMGQGAHAAIGAIGQQLRHRINGGRIDQRLIALHVDHDVLVLQAQRIAGFCQTVAAGGVIAAGQNGLNLVRFAR